MGPKGGQFIVTWCLQFVIYLSIFKVAEESLLTATQQTSVAAQGTQVLTATCPLLTQTFNRRKWKKERCGQAHHIFLSVLPICLSAAASAHVVGQG